MSVQIGIIGGSGLYDMAELTDREEKRITTPFGDPSGPYVIGTLGGKRVAFLARHGAGHRSCPSELNFRANIYGFKVLGVERILSASAVGSLKAGIQAARHPRARISSSIGPRGASAPSSAAASSRTSRSRIRCARDLSAIAADAAQAVGATVHRGGTYVNMEGPQFSTLAESKLYRSWGMDVIGMTNLQEAKLAREAEICYATLALVTDYDCWHPDHDSVTVEMIIGNLMQNARTAQQAIARAIGSCRRRALRMQGRAGDGDHHQAGGDPRADQEGSGADYREIREVASVAPVDSGMFRMTRLTCQSSIASMPVSPESASTALAVAATARAAARGGRLGLCAQRLPAAGVSDIIDRADVARGTFYLYFDSKEEVFLAIVEDFHERHQGDAGRSPTGRCRSPNITAGRCCSAASAGGSGFSRRIATPPRSC